MLELHGTTHETVCVACGDVRDRRRFQLELRTLNPSFAEAVDASERKALVKEKEKRFMNETRPDGDVELANASLAMGDFVVPRCRRCGGGPVKPRVVFFGDAVSRRRIARRPP